jgi:AAA15 family ATPase/GTPase
MINGIEIDNFRCFNKTQISGFQRVNLIGGKNNSGKTALLEAIFLGISPRIISVARLRRIRQIDTEFLKEVPDKAWDDLFLNRSNGAKIILKSDENSFNLSMFVDQSLEDFDQVTKENSTEQEEDIDIKEILSNRDSLVSTLHLIHQVNSLKAVASTGLAHRNGVLMNDLNIPDLKTINFVPSNAKVSNKALVQEYDKAYLNNFSDVVLDGLKLIDNDVKAIQSIYVGTPTLYLKYLEDRFLPIGLFGDAIGKVINYLLRIVNNKDGILLIDEIENGIHYSNQEFLWEKLFLLAQKFNVQIFATTHSIEMINAFKKVLAKEQFSNDGGYFELFRHYKTNEISANNRSVKDLEYDLQNNIPVRG